MKVWDNGGELHANLSWPSLWASHIAGCLQLGGQDPVISASAELVEASFVASWFDAASAILTAGEPTGLGGSSTR
jgi:hypothetical protein